jgi:hypothetical protein
LPSALAPVIFVVEHTDTGDPAVRVRWPGAPSGPRSYRGHPVTLDLKDASLGDVFRLMADVTRSKVVVAPNTRGAMT